MTANEKAAELIKALENNHTVKINDEYNIRTSARMIEVKAQLDGLGFEISDTDFSTFPYWITSKKGGYPIGVNDELDDEFIEELCSILEIEREFVAPETIENLCIDGVTVSHFGQLCEHKQIKKSLVGYDFSILRYCAMRLEILREGYGLSMEKINSDAATCSDELHLNKFTGYELFDGFSLEALYLNEYGRPVARIANTNTGDSYSYWID